MSRSQLRLAFWAFLTLSFGFMVGVMGRGDHKTSLQPEKPDVPIASPPGSTPAPAARPPESAKRLEQQEAENRKLEQRLTELELGLAAARSSAGADTPHVMLQPAKNETADATQTPEGPLPFPADLGEAYTPKGFEDVALRATKECGMPLSVVAIDCSEFPCIAWTRVTGPSEPGQPFSMDDCRPWAEVFKNGTMVVGSVSHADVEPREVYFAWMAVPEQEDLVRPAMARARQRTAEMKAALNLQ